MNKEFKEYLKSDYCRYGGKPPKYEKKFLYYFRKCQFSKGLARVFWKFLYRSLCRKRNIEFPTDVQIGKGLYIGHSNGITINPNVIIGTNCNIHKNVTIGQENRGPRKGTPIIGNSVYLGINTVVVGKITIGDDVMIAPGAFVNFDVPSHSIVIGNPGRIITKQEATYGYIQNPVR